MKRTLLAAAAAALFVSSANASVIDPGETFDATITVFGPGGGGFLYPSVNATFDGTPDVLTSPFAADINLTTTINDLGGGLFDILIQIATVDGSNMIPGALSVGGDVIDTIVFDFGGGNAGTDSLAFNQELIFLGATQEWFVDGAALTPPGGLPIIPATDGFQMSDNPGITGGPGFDLSLFGLDEAAFTFGFQIIPEPATLALLGLGGLTMVRRRRAS